MNCDQFRKRLMESGALGTPVEGLAHMEGCGGCATLFQRQRRLETGLKEMAAAQSGWSAPLRVEAALREEFRAHSSLQPAGTVHARPPFLVRFRLPALAATGALAAALALLLISRTPHPPFHVASHTVGGAAISQVAETEDDSALDNGFVPLPYFANSGEIPDAAEGDVVRVEMPRSELVTLGVPVSDEGDSATVEAELLLGEGGVPQAVRVLE